MAISLIKIGNSTNIPTHHYFCDEASDKDGLDVTRVPMGSTCYVINASREYVLNSSKEWKEKITQTAMETAEE